MVKYGAISVSIDKIKLKCRLRLKCGKPILSPCKPIPNIRTWCQFFLHEKFELLKEGENFFINRYRFWFDVRLRSSNEGTFHIEEHFNGSYAEQREKPYQFQIEYNPNKSGAEIYRAFCDVFVFDVLEIISFDLAYDVPGSKSSDIFVNTTCDVMTYGKTNNYTTYIAPKEDRSGRVKVYDKKSEREVHGVELVDTLRIEVTIKCRGLDFNTVYLDNKTFAELSKVVEHLNAVKIKRKAPECEDWKIYALSCLTPEQLQKCLGMMSQTTRLKTKKKVTESTYYCLDLDVSTLVIHIAEVLTPWKARISVK